MKKLLPFLLIAPVLALMPLATGTAGQAQALSSSETLVSDAPAPEPLCGKCGDGFCSKSCGETADSCPQDCGVSM